MTNLNLGGNEFKNVKNIIFDLGGVIVDIDFHLTINAFKKLGIEEFDKIFTQFKQSVLFDKLDKGLVTPDEFRKGIRDITGVAISDIDFDKAWNAMLLDIPAKRIQVLQDLKSKYATFLLSNTNEIHLDFFFNKVKKEHRINEFASLFHKAYYSCRIGMRKPDAEIYSNVLIENNLIPSETLFIDDLDLNVEAAKSLGIHGYIMKKTDELSVLFKENI